MKKYFITFVSVLFIFSMPFVFTNISASYEEPFNFLINPMPWIMLLVFLGVLVLLVWLVVAALNKVQELENEKKGVIAGENTDRITLKDWYKAVMQKWTNSKPIEEEGEIIIDHNYDGIKELDNSLPPWWIYLFYATIIFAVVYLVRFEILDGDSQVTEYNKAVTEAKASLKQYKKTATDIIDVNTVVLSTDQKDLDRGKAVYNLNCAACHMPDGGGGIGPNLTDEYWILGGGIKNVYASISEGGRDGKGMIAWKSTLKPKDISKVSSYILFLQGKTPANPKKAEGDIWKE